MCHDVMQRHLKCGCPRIPAMHGDQLILCCILSHSSLLDWGLGKRRWFVISLPTAFSLFPVPRIGHIPVTRNSRLIEQSSVGMRRQDEWSNSTPPLGGSLPIDLINSITNCAVVPDSVISVHYLSLLMTDPRSGPTLDGSLSLEALILTVPKNCFRPCPRCCRWFLPSSVPMQNQPHTFSASYS